MAEEQQSFVDTMAETEPPVADSSVGANSLPAPGGDGKTPGEAAPPSQPGADPRIETILQRLDKTDEDLFKARQETAYWRGAASRNDRVPDTTKARRPELYVPDMAALKTAMETDPVAAVADLNRKTTEAAVAQAQYDLRQEFDGKLNRNQQQTNVSQQLQQEAREISSEYADLIGRQEDGGSRNEAFDRECYDYLQGLARQAGMPLISTGPNAGSYALAPGMMRAAADAVYGRWARAGKIGARPKSDAAPSPPRPSLRELIDQVPASDHLGSNGGNRNGGSSGIPKTLEDLQNTGYFRSEKEVRAARNICRANGWDEAAFVRNAVEATRNGELDER